MKRLVSAIYGDYYPFITWKMFQDYETIQEPEKLRQGDTVVIWGGGDISPSFYNKGRSSHGGGSVLPGRRDQAEWDIMKRAVELKCPIIGVCRGGQMLTAMMGGHLIQHIHGHAGMSHNVTTIDGKNFMVNSIHHQMMVPPAKDVNYELVGWTTNNLSDEYWDVDENGTDELVVVDKEPEFIYYPDVQGFAIQWHPEGMREIAPATEYLKTFIGERV